jgi:CheY-like chemotaxis protein
MSRILLVDDSPHAQRIGERILVDEGFEVVTVSTADSALVRLEDADPDVLVCKGLLPGRNGYDICRFVKMSPRHRHVRVVLTSGVTESLDPGEVERSGADGTLKKPFEASALLAAVRPLAEAAQRDRGAPPGSSTVGGSAPALAKSPDPKLTAPMIAVIDPEQVRAAVTVALDASMAAMTEELTTRVLAALTARRAPGEKIESRPAPPAPAASTTAPPMPAAEPVRSIHRPSGPFTNMPGRQALRIRPGSILGLEIPEALPPATETPDPKDRS